MTIALNSVRLINYGCITDATITIVGGITMIYGCNNSGKSTIISSFKVLTNDYRYATMGTQVIYTYTQSSVQHVIKYNFQKLPDANGIIVPTITYDNSTDFSSDVLTNLMNAIHVITLNDIVIDTSVITSDINNIIYYIAGLKIKTSNLIQQNSDVYDFNLMSASEKNVVSNLIIDRNQKHVVIDSDVMDIMDFMRMQKTLDLRYDGRTLIIIANDIEKCKFLYHYCVTHNYHINCNNININKSISNTINYAQFNFDMFAEIIKMLKYTNLKMKYLKVANEDNYLLLTGDTDNDNMIVNIAISYGFVCDVTRCYLTSCNGTVHLPTNSDPDPTLNYVYIIQPGLN